jgi:hypothetical protein
MRSDPIGFGTTYIVRSAALIQPNHQREVESTLFLNNMYARFIIENCTIVATKKNGGRGKILIHWLRQRSNGNKRTVFRKLIHNNEAPPKAKSNRIA